MDFFSIKEELKLKQFAVFNPKILIIDDEEGFRKALEEMFTIIGCRIYSAENGKEGLDIFGQHKIFDLVILDMQMPIMDGRIVYRRIRKINPKQNILIMSGETVMEDLDEVMKKSIKGFIRKPFSIYKIIGKVRDILYT